MPQRLTLGFSKEDKYGTDGLLHGDNRTKK